jgi:S1-C subfamily serine protease
MLPGFSGGPLVDASARVIGMNSSVLGRGVSLAVPVETMRRVVTDLLKEGRVKRAFLGVGLQIVPLAPSLSAKAKGQERGLMVLTLESGGPAEPGGLLPGDILLSAGDIALTDLHDLQRVLAPDAVGKPLALSIVRGGEIRSVNVTVGAK